MSTVRDLAQLQDIELAIEANEQAQLQTGHALTDNHIVVNAQARLAAAQQSLEEHIRKQKAIDTEIEDFSAKLKTINRKLYDGKTTNSKELSNLQTEANDFQKKRAHLEDQSLELMEAIESIRKNIVVATEELTAAEAAWEEQRINLNTELVQLHTDRAALDIKRHALIAEIEPAALVVYKEAKKRRGMAVARVEQGICRGCRIAVSNAELQQVKIGHIARCNNCGRILYLP